MQNLVIFFPKREHYKVLSVFFIIFCLMSGFLLHGDDLDDIEKNMNWVEENFWRSACQKKSALGHIELDDKIHEIVLSARKLNDEMRKQNLQNSIEHGIVRLRVDLYGSVDHRLAALLAQCNFVWTVQVSPSTDLQQYLIELAKCHQKNLDFLEHCGNRPQLAIISHNGKWHKKARNYVTIHYQCMRDFRIQIALLRQGKMARDWQANFSTKELSDEKLWKICCSQVLYIFLQFQDAGEHCGYSDRQWLEVDQELHRLNYYCSELQQRLMNTENKTVNITIEARKIRLIFSNWKKMKGEYPHLFAELIKKLKSLTFSEKKDEPSDQMEDSDSAKENIPDSDSTSESPLDEGIPESESESDDESGTPVAPECEEETELPEMQDGNAEGQKSGTSKKTLILEMGLDNTIRFDLRNGRLYAVDFHEWGNHYGGIGTHYGLRDWPKLYFGYPACYANGKLWKLQNPLPLPGKAKKILKVELLNSGRRNVSVGTQTGPCWIIWDEKSVLMEDNEGSSSMYKIKIYFK